MSYLQALRTIQAACTQRMPWIDVDDDLDREAGMDGNYGHLLQVARDLDAAEAAWRDEQDRTAAEAGPDHY